MRLRVRDAIGVTAVVLACVAGLAGCVSPWPSMDPSIEDRATRYLVQRYGQQFVYEGGAIYGEFGPPMSTWEGMFSPSGDQRGINHFAVTAVPGRFGYVFSDTYLNVKFVPMFAAVLQPSIDRLFPVNTTQMYLLSDDLLKSLPGDIDGPAFREFASVHTQLLATVVIRSDGVTWAGVDSQLAGMVVSLQDIGVRRVGVDVYACQDDVYDSYVTKNDEGGYLFTSQGLDCVFSASHVWKA